MDIFAGLFTLLVPFVFIALVVGLIVYGIRQSRAQRAAVEAQVQGLRTKMGAFVARSRELDSKTSERVGLAQVSVEEKLAQATSLLSTASKPRHYARIQRILALVEAKLSNVEASLGRAQARTDEREQRQAEAAARRAGSFGGGSSTRFGIGSMQTATIATGGGSGVTSGRHGGSFSPPVQVTGATTAWVTIPISQRGVCFFCSRPCLLPELTPVTLPIAGTTRRVLACPEDFMTIRSGGIPSIRSFGIRGQHVPWYAYNRYDPYRDYYQPYYYETWEDVVVETMVFEAFDPGYWDFDGPYGYQGGQPYVFTPDAEPYRDYYSEQAAGALPPDAPVPAFDPNGNPNYDLNYPSNGDPHVGGVGPDGQFIGPDIS